jgi:hypothetical protein
MMCGSRWRAVLAVVLASLPFLVAMSADAQRGRGHATKDAGAAATSTAHNIQVGSKDAGAGTEGVKANADAGVLEAKTLDGGTRVFRFGEMEVEGRLRSPQIVYFLRRVRAEFAAGDLGHRSFLGELSDTRKSSAF